MSLRSLIHTREGEWRAIWRLLLFALVFAGSLLVVGAILLPLLTIIIPTFGLGSFRADAWALAAAALLAHFVMLRIERRDWKYVALDRRAARPALLAHGFAIGLATITVPILALIGVGWLDRVDSGQGSYLGAAMRVTLVLLPAALSEELLMRGYFFSVIRTGWNAAGAVSVTSIVFGLMHILNEGASALSLVYVVLAGVFLGAVLLATNSLFAAWMAHFAFNWGMVVLFHATVSGLPMEAPGYRYVDAGPDWATGGEWGPEAGVPAGVGMLGAIAYLHARRRRRQEN